MIAEVVDRIVAAGQDMGLDITSVMYRPPGKNQATVPAISVDKELTLTVAAIASVQGVKDVFETAAPLAEAKCRTSGSRLLFF